MSDGYKKSAVVFVKEVFLSGLAVILPLFITAYLIYLLLKFSNDIAGEYINDVIYSQFGITVPGLGLIILLLLIVLVGIVSRILLVRKIFSSIERYFMKIPFIANIYPSAKELSGFLFTSTEREKFKKVVLVEYPLKGSYSIGFVTNRSVDAIEAKTEKGLISVLVPLAPAPFSGLLLYIKEDMTIPVDLSIEEAVKLIVSGGVVIPKSLAKK